MTAATPRGVIMTFQNARFCLDNPSGIIRAIMCPEYARCLLQWIKRHYSPMVPIVHLKSKRKTNKENINTSHRCTSKNSANVDRANLAINKQFIILARAPSLFQ
jgi:hypothetical protein